MQIIASARWFSSLGSCTKCGRAATGTLMGDRNQSLGAYCERCATATIKAADKAMAALDARWASAKRQNRVVT